jgi:nucleotidyltransferase/DNA polymerase involved in DNA repair
MARARSRRLRLLESLRRTLSEKLHLQVWRAARQCGRHAPENTAAIYAMAKAATPDLLDQLLLVHHRVLEEETKDVAEHSTPPLDDIERKRMLSAVRATVDRASSRLGNTTTATS